MWWIYLCLIFALVMSYVFYRVQEAKYRHLIEDREAFIKDLVNEITESLKESLKDRPLVDHGRENVEQDGAQG